jgi:YD repeat-containing protein
VPVVASTPYNERGQVTQITHGNGTSTAYAYSPERSFLTRVTTTPVTGQGLDLVYARDLKGRITSVDSSVNVEDWAYSYDALSRLTLADNLGDNAQDRWFNHDLADNLIFNSAIGCGAWPQNIAYPAQGVWTGRPHAPTAICGTPVTYDANGNTLSYDADGAGPEPLRAFTYDAENRPLSITRNGVATSFTYDPLGERASKQWGQALTVYAVSDVRRGPLTQEIAAIVFQSDQVGSWKKKCANSTTAAPANSVR